jgi:hypothetical protein
MFAASAVTGLTSGAGQGVVNPAQIARMAFDIAAQLETIFAAADGAPAGAQVVVNLHQAPVPQPSIAAFQQANQPHQGAPYQAPPPAMMPAAMGATVHGGAPSLAGFPQMPSFGDAPASGEAAGPAVDWEDPNPMALSNREARHWRRLIPSLPPRPPAHEESGQAANARKMRLFMISNYKSVMKDWPMAYMKPPAEGGVGEPPPEGLNALAQ